MTHQVKRRVMNGSCRKCGGFLIVEQALDSHSPTSGMKFINCEWYYLDVQPSLGPARCGNRGTYK